MLPARRLTHSGTKRSRRKTTRQMSGLLLPGSIRLTILGPATPLPCSHVLPLIGKRALAEGEAVEMILDHRLHAGRCLLVRHCEPDMKRGSVGREMRPAFVIEGDGARCRSEGDSEFVRPVLR